VHYVYIIKSQKTDHYYVGETPNVDARIDFHNDSQKNTNSTKRGIPWELYWKLQVEDRAIAKKIEGHIKRLKSRKYIEDIRKYKDVSEKLIVKYSN
jgi:putative endonuclease